MTIALCHNIVNSQVCAVGLGVIPLSDFIYAISGCMTSLSIHCRFAARFPHVCPPPCAALRCKSLYGVGTAEGDPCAQLPMRCDCIPKQRGPSPTATLLLEVCQRVEIAYTTGEKANHCGTAATLPPAQKKPTIALRASGSSGVLGSWL